MCAIKPITNYLVLEIPLTPGTSSYTFPDDGTLRAAKRITSFRPQYAYVAGMKTPEGVALCDAATFRQGYLNIKQKGTMQPIQQLSLTELALIPVAANGNTQPPVQVDIANINPSACTVQFGDTSAVTAGDVLLIGVYFEM